MVKPNGLILSLVAEVAVRCYCLRLGLFRYLWSEQQLQDVWPSVSPLTKTHPDQELHNTALLTSTSSSKHPIALSTFDCGSQLCYMMMTGSYLPWVADDFMAVMTRAHW